MDIQIYISHFLSTDLIRNEEKLTEWMWAFHLQFLSWLQVLFVTPGYPADLKQWCYQFGSHVERKEPLKEESTQQVYLDGVLWTHWMLCMCNIMYTAAHTFKSSEKCLKTDSNPMAKQTEIGCCSATIPCARLFRHIVYMSSSHRLCLVRIRHCSNNRDKYTNLLLVCSLPSLTTHWQKEKESGLLFAFFRRLK